MEIENALYESRYVEDVWNAINNIAQNGVKNGIKKTIQDYTQKKANIENKNAADESLEAASKNFMTDKEWQTFVNSVGTIIQNNKKKLSPKNSSNKNVTKEVDKTNNVISTEADVQPPKGEAE